MKLIPLTKGKFAQVDDEDYDFLMQWKWHTLKTPHNFYAQRMSRVGEKNPRGAISIHRVVMKTANHLLVDHIDHDGLNNQKYNLRNCGHSGNAKNTKSRKNSTSKYLGVCVNKIIKNGKAYYYWSAHIRLNNKQKHIGHFKSEENAAIAYNIFAEKHHGEFSNLNTICLK